MKNRIGLIGCGNWGKNILRDLLQLQCQVFVADIDIKRRVLAEGLGAAAVFNEAIELPDCDGYVVAVTIPELAQVCLNLLPKKKPIFAEKTLLQSMPVADELTALDADDYIFTMHKWVYHPGVEALKQISQSGEIGHFREMFCFRHGWVTDFHGGDIFWTIAVHDLTIVKQIIGYLPDHIQTSHAIREKAGTPVALTASLGDGPVAHISASARHTEKLSRISIHGEKGSAILRNATDNSIIIRNESGEKKVKIDTTFPLFLELKEFVSYLNGGNKPRCSFNDAREISQYLLKLRAKSENL